jgi:hypothetical protein
MRCELAALRFRLALKRLIDHCAKAGYDPTQPRVPAGNPDGGQWTDDPRWAGGGNGGDSVDEGNDVNPDTASSSQNLLSPTQMAGIVIRICVAGSRSVTVDRWGNKSYWVEYQCAGGRSFIRRGRGDGFPGIMIDPFK